MRLESTVTKSKKFGLTLKEIEDVVQLNYERVVKEGEEGGGEREERESTREKNSESRSIYKTVRHVTYRYLFLHIMDLCCRH